MQSFLIQEIWKGVLRFCISNMFFSNVDATGPKSMTGEPLYKYNFNKFCYMIVKSRLAGNN